MTDETAPIAPIAPMLQLLTRRYTAVLQDALKPLGLSPGQMPALMALWAQDGQTQKALVDMLGVEQATMANTLSRMERDGLITRRAVDGDKRIRHIHLTEQARGVEQAALDATAGAEAALLAPLRPGQQKRLAGFLAELSAQGAAAGA